MRRGWILWFGLSLFALGNAQIGETGYVNPDSVMDFWRAPGRYTQLPLDDVSSRGIWQVRLTTSGSQWLWNYNRGRKLSAPPTADPKPTGDEQKLWEDWVQSRIARDRWDAFQVAQRSNLAVLGKALPIADKNIPLIEPPIPGPMPKALMNLVGNVPRFAEVVVPMQHVIQFPDITLRYIDNVQLSSPRYAYYRFANGTASEGKSVRSMPEAQLLQLFKKAGCTESEAKIMRSVSSLEGGFDAINTYDTGYVSIGFIQFASLKEGSGSLGGMLLLYKKTSPDSFYQDFQRYGIDINAQGTLVVIDPSTGAELVGPEANAKIIDDKRLIAVFQRAGLLSTDFQAVQIRAAKSMFYPVNDQVNVAGVGPVRIGDIIKSEAGMATLMDRKVNTGRIEPITEVLNRISSERSLTSVNDLCACEYEIVAALKYRKDYLADAGLSQPSRPLDGNKASRGDGKRGKRGGGWKG